MYRGFNVDIPIFNKKFLEAGKVVYNKYDAQVSTDLAKYISLNGSLRGTMMQDDWFPTINSDIFISHSHGDRDNAISMAGYLKENFGINAFIDSCIWGNSSVLLKTIDEKYCKNLDDKTYSYEKRNESTSHVHMMLSVALTKMINKTECLFFLNTPNSITSSGVINKTASPWIYSEIATAQMIRKPLEFHRQLGTKYFSKGGVINENLNVEYDLQLDEFFDLDADDLKAWVINWRENKRGNPLDNLYKLHPYLNSIIHS